MRMVRLTIRKKWCWKVFRKHSMYPWNGSKGETDEYETDITDKRELQIRDAMGDILEQLPLALTKKKMLFQKIYYC